jgi:hypothetical protein
MGRGVRRTCGVGADFAGTERRTVPSAWNVMSCLMPVAVVLNQEPTMPHGLPSLWYSSLLASCRS